MTSADNARKVRYEHHQRAIDLLVARYSDNPAFPALIVGGSIAKDDATAASDVDVMFVASDEEYQRRRLAQELAFVLYDVCDYSGGYVDAKVFPLDFLREAAVRGSEPTRSSFAGAFFAYSRIPELEDLMRRIAVYPQAEQQHKIESFYSQFKLNAGYFWKQAEKREDPYLKARVAAEMVLFGGRLILAHNKILFPSQKWLMQYVERAPEKPEGFALLAQRLLQTPGRETVEQFTACIEGFRDWGVTTNVLMRFIEDTEWSWYTRAPAVAEW